MANESQSRTARRKQMKASKKGKNKSKSTSKFKKIFMTLLTIGIVLMLGIGGLFVYYAASAPSLDESKLSDPFSSKVYDQNDELVADLAGDERRTKITYEDIPAVLEDAVLATEDVRFYDHIGIDFRRIGGALIANITGGFGAEGASTITQQVVKESFLSTDKTIKRKVQEQYLAVKLDQQYSKEKILEMYLNKIYYGAGAYGVAEAAETYFGKKDLSELTLAESALLAGLPQRPSGYMPFENPDLAKDRMNIVLSLMVQHGKITEKEASEARDEDIPDMLIERQPEKETPYQAFIDRVAKEVDEKMDADIFKDGLKIYTTLDKKAQENVQQLLSNEGQIAWPDDELQTGVAVTDTKSGAIKAVGGGRNYQKESFNFATDIKRQPGSIFKPIAAYGPAIQHNKISTYHQIKDEETDFGGWTPSNFDNEFRGWVSARYALSRSLNIPAAKMMEEVGLDKAESFAEGLGIDLPDSGFVDLSEAIGGGKTGVNPVQMAGAYAAFGNGGVYNEPFTVRKVEVPGEGTIDLTPEPESAMSSYTAYMISNMLQTTMSEGSGRAANVPGLQEAGKTGTTNRGDTAPDSWFNGYTTNYSISIWTGYTDESGLSQAAKDIPKQIFKPLMTQLSEGIETPDFSKPDSVAWVDVEKGSRPARLPSEYTPSDRITTELFHVDNQPSKVSEEYQQLDPVNSLNGAFNEESSSIDLSWNYGTSEGITFRIAASIDGGEMRELTTTKEKNVEITSIDPGATYEFSVVAMSDDGESANSEPATVQVQTPGSLEQEPPEDPAEEEPEEGSEEENPENDESDNNSEDGPPPEENNGDDQGNNNGEGNENDEGNNNGNENGNENGEGNNNGNENGNENGEGNNNGNENGNENSEGNNNGSGEGDEEEEPSEPEQDSESDEEQPSGENADDQEDSAA